MKNEDLELLFITGELPDIPKDKQYLLKYFRKPMQQAFLKYYLVFGEVKNFVQRTGYCSSTRWLNAMRSRFHKLEAAHAAAKANFDMEQLTIIEKGKYKLLPDGRMKL